MGWTTPKTWSVGEVVTAANMNLHLRDNLNALYQVAKMKASNETVNNSTTLQNDDHLVLAVNASTKYTLVAFLIGFADNDTPDIKIKWILPTGGTMRWAELRELGAGTQALTELTEVSEAALPTTNANKIFLFTGAVTIAGTAGNVQLQWAQNILTAVNVKLLTSSFFTLTEI